MGDDQRTSQRHPAPRGVVGSLLNWQGCVGHCPLLREGDCLSLRLGILGSGWCWPLVRRNFKARMIDCQGPFIPSTARTFAADASEGRWPSSLHAKFMDKPKTWASAAPLHHPPNNPVSVSHKRRSIHPSSMSMSIQSEIGWPAASAVSRFASTQMQPDAGDDALAGKQAINKSIY
jgi:hypothetical protein